MMKLEEMITVEDVNCNTVGDQFARDHRNVMLIERAVRHAIRFFVGQVASEDRNSLKAEVMATQILHVNGQDNWCKGRVNIRCGRRGNV